MKQKIPLLYTTTQGIEIFVKPGSRSVHDFILQYKEPGKRVRTLQHLHLITALYLKLANNEAVTMYLIDHILDKIIARVQPTSAFPPELQIFDSSHITPFLPLNAFGEYSVEFILVITELMMIQEKTNYPTGAMNRAMFENFRNKKDIFTVVSTATFSGRRRR